jgi:hypothetical protein
MSRARRPSASVVRRPRRGSVVAVALAAAGLLAAAGPAGAAELPTAPTDEVRASATLPSGWSVEERGPRTYRDQRTTQLVVKRPDGAVDALLYPETAAGDLCDARSDEFHCQPMRTILGPEVPMGTKGLLVTDVDGDGIPEVAISMYTGGAHCCVITVGYWRDAQGAWKDDETNGGSFGGTRSDARGRVEVADPAFEGLDWSYAASQAYVTWARLVPGRGWVDASTTADHRRQITLMDRAVRRFARRRDASEAVQAARAVRIAHRKALGQTARLASERRTYRRAYGKGPARRLDRALRGVVTVR